MGVKSWHLISGCFTPKWLESGLKKEECSATAGPDLLMWKV